MPLHKTIVFCIPHQSLMMRQSGKWITPHLKNAASASRHDSQETTRLDEDSEHSSVDHDRISPTPYTSIACAFSYLAV